MTEDEAWRAGAEQALAYVLGETAAHEAGRCPCSGNGDTCIRRAVADARECIERDLERNE